MAQKPEEKIGFKSVRIFNEQKDNERDRPPAERLCEGTASLKATAQYSDARDRMTRGGRDEAALNQDNQRLNQDNQRLEREKNRVIQEKEQRVNNQLEESERARADYVRQVVELEGQLSQRDQLPRRDDRPEADSKTEIKLRWREGEKAPCKMTRYYDAVVEGGVVYFTECDGLGVKIRAYHTSTSKWSLVPDCPLHGGFALAVINGTLTTVGGFDFDSQDTNKLFSLTGAGEDGEKTWSEDFPPMPTKRYQVCVLYIGTALIVVGGTEDYEVCLKTVEILDTSTRQWQTATELPQPLDTASMAVCGDGIYLLGGKEKDYKWTPSVYTCLLSTLLMSVGGRIARALSRSSTNDTWTRVADLPMTLSTAVSLHGQLIAVGGKDLDNKPTSDIHRYNPSTNSWEVISHMATPRSKCFAAVLPDNQLMVVGGYDSDDVEMDSVEFGRVE